MLGLKGTGNWLVFILYMSFCVNHGVLVTWTQDDKRRYGYNATAAVLHTEALKLLITIILALYNLPLSSILQEISSNYHVLGLYFIPAFLYAVYNNLTFHNLTYFDLTTYYILMQLKIVISGFIYQIIFNRRLSTKQWVSLVFLMFGCMVKQLHPTDRTPGPESGADKLGEGDGEHAWSLLAYVPHPGLVLILVQLLCSTIASVYTEYIIKQRGKNLNIWIQNAFMYADSIVCGLIIFASSRQPVSKLLFLIETGANDPGMYPYKVVAVVCNMAAMGLTTAVFLKSLNSIVKNFATALEVILTAVVSWLMFGIPITVYTLVAMVIILISVYVYSTNPLVQKGAFVPGRKSKLSERDDENGGIDK